MPGEKRSLSELLEQVKGALKKELPAHYWVIAEILEFRENRHCYLELIEKSEENDSLLAKGFPLWHAPALFRSLIRNSVKKRHQDSLQGLG